MCFLSRRGQDPFRSRSRSRGVARGGASRADDSGRHHAVEAAAVHRRCLHAGELGPLLGRPAQAGERQYRHRHDGGQHLVHNYGITDRLNVIGAVPYVWTRASQGVLHGLDGFQDLTLAAKFNALERSDTNAGALRAIGVLSVGIPLTNYNGPACPDAGGGSLFPHVSSVVHWLQEAPDPLYRSISSAVQNDVGATYFAVSVRGQTGLTSSIRQRGPPRYSGCSDFTNAGASPPRIHTWESGGCLPSSGARRPEIPPISTFST